LTTVIAGDVAEARLNATDDRCGEYQTVQEFFAAKN